MKTKTPKCAVGLIWLALIASTARAEVVIDVGNHVFRPNETRTIALYARGGVWVNGMSFYIQLGDGGAPLGGSDTCPKITNVDIVGPGTLFAGNNDGQWTTYETDQFWDPMTMTLHGEIFVDASRALAFVTLNTAGTTEGQQFPLLLSGIAGYLNTSFTNASGNQIDPIITNGTVTIASVPEPGTIALLLTGLFAALGFIASDLSRRNRQYRGH